MNEVLRVCSLPVDYITRSICSAYAAWNFYFYQKLSLKKILSLTFPNMPLSFFKQIVLYVVQLRYTQILHF